MHSTNAAMIDAQQSTSEMTLSCSFVISRWKTRLTNDESALFLPCTEVFTSFFSDRKQRLVMFSACLIALCIDLTDTLMIQYWSLAAIPLIAMYNGERGKHSLKYFFYVFYPLHLAVLYGIQYFINLG